MARSERERCFYYVIFLKICIYISNFFRRGFWSIILLYFVFILLNRLGKTANGNFSVSYVGPAKHFASFNLIKHLVYCEYLESNRSYSLRVSHTTSVFFVCSWFFFLRNHRNSDRKSAMIEPSECKIPIKRE